MGVLCIHCKKQFLTRSTLNKHLRVVHVIKVQPLAYEKDVNLFKCLDGCNVSFKFNADLRNHLEKDHGVSNEVLVKKFVSYEEFLTWLKIEEKNNDVRYQKSRTKKRNGPIIEKIYFNCARSGKQRIKSEENLKRKTKRQGSSKLNLYCTSQIIISKEDTGECSMTYFKNHYGHGTDIHHLRLSKCTREDVVSKLLMGVPSEHIVDSICHSSNQQKRDDFLTRKDINNIKNSLNVQHKSGHEEKDATGVHLYIEELVESEQNYESESELVLVSNTLNMNDLKKLPQQSPTEEESHQGIVSEIQSAASQIIDDVEAKQHNIDDLKLILQNLKAAASICSKESNVNVSDPKTHSDKVIKKQTMKKSGNKNSKNETKIIEKFLETTLWMSNDPANDHLYM